MNAVTYNHQSLLRDAAGIGLSGGKPTRRNLSLYMAGQFPQEVAELVAMGYLVESTKSGITTRTITDAGISFAESMGWWRKSTAQVATPPTQVQPVPTPTPTPTTAAAPASDWRSEFL